jgi:hypothetical protein
MKSAAILLCLLFTVSAHAQRGGSQLFSRYPFNAWAAEHAKAGIPWAIEFESARLTPHQRLFAAIRAHVGTSRLKVQPGNTHLVTLLRIEDASGGRYQTASTAWLGTPNWTGSYGDSLVTFAAYFLPGDYIVSLAVCDPQTLAHSFTRRRYHVAPGKSDLLAAAWKDLPAVEFLQPETIPSLWYRPELRSVLRLPLANEKPLRIELLVNVTPSKLGSLNLFRANMQAVIPSMKVLMGIDPAAGSVGLSIADINRQTIVYRQPDLPSRISAAGRRRDRANGFPSGASSTTSASPRWMPRRSPVQAACWASFRVPSHACSRRLVHLGF